MVDDRLDEVAPDFELRDISGATWRLSDLVGRVVVLNFWATWCGPCQEELPHFEALTEEYAGEGRVLFLAIATDAEPGVVAPWLGEQGLVINALYDNGAALDYNVTGIPTTVIVGREGRVQYRDVGFAGAEIYLELMRLRISSLLED